MDFLRRMFSAALGMFRLPDANDSAAVRRYIQGVLAFLATAADWTPTQIDDEAVTLAQKVVGDDETWAAIHAFLVARLANEPGPELTAESGGLAAVLLGLYGETDVA